MTTTEPVVVEAPGRGRYEIRLDEVLVGFVSYLETDTQRIFHHTEIGDDFRGRGLAGALVREALLATRDAGKRIVAICPYVTAWLSGNAEASGLTSMIDEPTPEARAAAARAMA